MQTNAVSWLVAAFVVSFFAVGFPYWQIPYAKVSLPNTLYGPGLLVVGVLAAAARAFGKARLLGACRTSRIIKSQKPDAGLLHIGIMIRVSQQAGESV